jgi:hypothetical protein
VSGLGTPILIVVQAKMIRETCTRIEELEDYWTSEIRARHARRKRIRDIDDMLNQFEMLNLADEQLIPAELCQRVSAFIRTADHPLCERNPAAVSIPDWMEALYDVQDGLMIRFPDDID